jgi:hypothetical protein
VSHCCPGPAPALIQPSSRCTVRRLRLPHEPAHLQGRHASGGVSVVCSGVQGLDPWMPAACQGGVLSVCLLGLRALSVQAFLDVSAARTKCQHPGRPAGQCASGGLTGMLAVLGWGPCFMVASTTTSYMPDCTGSQTRCAALLSVCRRA